MSSSSSPAIRTDRVRMIGLITAKPGMSLEAFDKRWLQHGELIRSLGVIKRNIVKYEQVHFPADVDPAGCVRAEHVTRGHRCTWPRVCPRRSKAR